MYIILEKVQVKEHTQIKNRFVWSVESPVAARVVFNTASKSSVFSCLGFFCSLFCLFVLILNMESTVTWVGLK